MASHQCSLVASPSRDASLPQSAPTDPGSVRKNPTIRRFLHRNLGFWISRSVIPLSFQILPWKHVISLKDEEIAKVKEVAATCHITTSGQGPGFQPQAFSPSCLAEWSQLSSNASSRPFCHWRSSSPTWMYEALQPHGEKEEDNCWCKPFVALGLILSSSSHCKQWKIQGHWECMR